MHTKGVTDGNTVGVREEGGFKTASHPKPSTFPTEIGNEEGGN